MIKYHFIDILMKQHPSLWRTMSVCQGKQLSCMSLRSHCLFVPWTQLPGSSLCPMMLGHLSRFYLQIFFSLIRSLTQMSGMVSPSTLWSSHDSWKNCPFFLSLPWFLCRKEDSAWDMGLWFCDHPSPQTWNYHFIFSRNWYTGLDKNVSQSQLSPQVMVLKKQLQVSC